MAKRNTIQKEKEKILISNGMLKNCKNVIKQFGYTPQEYEKFLISVDAMNENREVKMFRNSDIENYSNKFLKQFSETNSLTDLFALEAFKIKSSDDSGREYLTGYFCPRSFWDYVLSTKI